MVLTIFVFLLTFSVLIFFHEAGHFLAAKKMGIKVEEFGFGYPPRLWGKKIGETIYSLNWIPFGGFVRLLGEDGEVSGKEEKRAFYRQGKLVRALVCWAGVLMNVFLAWLLFGVIFAWAGIPMETEQVTVSALEENSPAAKADLRAGDILLSLDGMAVKKTDEFIEGLKEKQGKEVTLGIKRGEDQWEEKVTLRTVTEANQGALGVLVSNYQLVRPVWWLLPWRCGWEAGREVYFWLKLIVQELGGMFKELFFAGKVPADVSGPVGIFQAAGQVSRSGALAVLQFIAILSLNLAIMNILPFPGLDGGRFFFIVMEALTGKQSPKKFEAWVNAAGMMTLIFLMVLVTANDLRRVWVENNFGLKISAWWPFN